ncbi:MAG: cupin domain-containing protein [Sphingobacteriales bacterium]|nr:MAG: cupin domain-containing protein [Sphingobacteriales bacterium]
MLTASYLVDHYQMQAHPEGGFYKQTYRSDEYLNTAHLPGRFGGERVISTAIYFLLEGNQFSAFHRIKSDELWHFYYGTSLNIYVIHLNGELKIIKLGNNIVEGENFQTVVPAGCWFASKPVKEEGFSFVGCTVAPGFDFADFELAKANSLIKEYPQHKDLIRRLCR